jgi:hypothetical protein
MTSNREKLFGKYTISFILREIEKHGALKTAADSLGISHITVRGFLERNKSLPKLGKPGSHSMRPTFKQQAKAIKPIAAGKVSAFDAKREQLKGKRFVFTSAQNNTRIHKKFWESLQTFCKFNDAQLFVSRFTYNKSGFQNGTKENQELWYDKRLSASILDASVVVAPGILFCGELDILPTANDPLSGLDSYCGNNSGIIPHAKVAMRSLPRLKGEPARFLYTTGCVTLRNYIARKAGQKAEFHHVYGALYVEVDASGEWFARQLIADNNGEFHDLDRRYRPTDSCGYSVAAINWGDIHIEKPDTTVARASWGCGNSSMLSNLRPSWQFVHDLTDFHARSHHEINDPYSLAAKYFKAEDRVEDGLRKSAEFLEQISAQEKVIVVESNHHEAFERWLKHANGHYDPVNAEFFHEANARKFKALREGEDLDIYEWALRRYKKLKNVAFLRADESFLIEGIECGMHGHLGINGSRGSAKSYRSIGKRVNCGHTHSAGIYDGVYVAGVSGKLDMGYNRGPSSWSHSHIVTYANGKRAIITVKNGKWRA